VQLVRVQEAADVMLLLVVVVVVADTAAMIFDPQDYSGINQAILRIHRPTPRTGPPFLKHRTPRHLRYN